MPDLKWEAPSPKYARKPKALKNEIKVMLTQRPNEWARLDELGESSTYARRINSGEYWGEGFEACTRTIDGVRYVFARYIGRNTQ